MIDGDSFLFVPQRFFENNKVADYFDRIREQYKLKDEWRSTFIDSCKKNLNDRGLISFNLEAEILLSLLARKNNDVTMPLGVEREEEEVRQILGDQFKHFNRTKPSVRLRVNRQFLLNNQNNSEYVSMSNV